MALRILVAVAEGVVEVVTGLRGMAPPSPARAVEGAPFVLSVVAVVPVGLAVVGESVLATTVVVVVTAAVVVVAVIARG